MADVEPGNALRAPLRFGPDARFELQPAQYRLLIDGKPAALGGRALDLLFALASRPSELFSKAELLERVWPGLIVEENNLRVQVNALRKLLGDELIATVPGRGYRLALPAPVIDAPTARASLAAPAQSPDRVPGLPAELDAFIGRDVELAALEARLNAGDRLVTVVGAGGAGKTRLVGRYAATRCRAWPGGVFFCDLSEARSVGGIASALAGTFDVALGAADPVRQLGNVIAGRGRCLVVLDNFEQVVAHAAATLGQWMTCADEARFVVTSRELLSLKGEHRISLGPMDPAGSGIELFAARAQARGADLALTPARRHELAQIVALVDGLPLAIELAAARAPLFSPAQLLARLREGLGLLSNARPTLARHATLRASIDWSWQLLEPWEQAALAQCSVFAGAFTVPAAEAVIDLSAWPGAPAVVDVLQSLLDRSLLRALSPFAGRSAALDVPYLGLLVSIREFAAEQLVGGAFGPEAAAAARRRHGRFYASSGTEDQLRAMDRHGGMARLVQLGADLENLIAAFRHALQRRDAEVATLTHAACLRVLESKGPFQLCVDMGQQILALPNLSERDWARATIRLAYALRLTGRLDEAAAQLHTAMQRLREAGDRQGQGQVHLHLGHLQGQFLGRPRDAEGEFRQALAIARETGDRDLQASALGSLGNVFDSVGRLDDARQHRWQAVALLRELGNLRLEAHELGNLLNGCLNEGQPAEALALADQALAIARECEDRRTEGHVLGNRGIALMELGRLAEARQDCDAALDIALESGNRRFESNVRRNLGDLLLLEGQPDEAVAQFERALDLARGVGNRVGEARICGHLGQALARRGQLDRARQAFAAGATLFQSLDEPVAHGELLCQHVRCELDAGESAAARGLLDLAEAATQQAGAVPGPALEGTMRALRQEVDRCQDDAAAGSRTNRAQKRVGRG